MSKYILVVDDEPDAREILDLVLGTLQIPIQQVTDGKVALDTIAKHKPLVMLLDLHMPTYDGEYVLNELNGRQIDIPVIIFTSHDITPELANKLGVSEEIMYQKGNISMTALRQQVIDIIRDDIQIDLSLL